jgi:tetratricopeptide (TPR) repeat protein
MDPDSDSPLLLALLGLGDAEAAQHGNLQAVRARAFAILRQFAINTSRDRPLVLALEDLHWVDKVSEEFLDWLVESLPGARILIIASYRRDYRPAWIGRSDAAQIDLQPLTRDDSRRVLRSVLDRRRLPERLAGTILARAEGNPFFLEQLALHVGEETEGAHSVPATIRDVVMARIDRLPAPTRRLLQIAAVAGREFSLGLIGAVWRRSETLEPLLDELLQSEFLYERSEAEETSYAFRHALTQDAAYTGLLARDRRRTHADVGRALETLYPGRTEEVAELLALHYDRSDSADKAVDYAILAAEKAQRRWANAEALSYFEAALRRLGAMPDTEPNRVRRIDAVIKQVEVKLALGHHAEHIIALSQIREIVEQHQDPRRRASWHYWMGFLGCLTGGHPTAAIEHCQEAATIAATAGFDELDGHIQSCLAQAYTVAGELRAAVEAGERAAAIFEARGNRWYASRALWHLSTAANYLGQWEASLGYCRRAYEHGAALDDVRLKGVALWRTGSAYIQRGDVDEGLRCCEEALALNPNPYDSATARLIRGYGFLKAGDTARGVTELDDVAAWFEQSHLPYIRSLAMLWLAEGHLAQHDHASGQAVLDQVLVICRANGYAHYEAMAHRLRGECVAVVDGAAAEAEVDRALHAFGRLGMRNDVAKALVTKAQLRRVAGEIAAAGQLLRQALGIYETLGTRGEPIHAKAALAELDQHTPTDPAEASPVLHSLAAPSGRYVES